MHQIVRQTAIISSAAGHSFAHIGFSLQTIYKSEAMLTILIKISGNVESFYGFPEKSFVPFIDFTGFFSNKQKKGLFFTFILYFYYIKPGSMIKLSRIFEKKKSPDVSKRF